MLLDKDFSPLEQKINYHFKDRRLLKTAFVHRSALNELHDHINEHNERLEFLGDAVLELIVTENLFLHYPNPEGELTNWRSALVRGQHLAEKAKDLGFGDYLYLSHGETKSGGKAKQMILANTFEAFLGALYLDGGYKIAKNFVEQTIICHLSEILAEGLDIDPKSRFQELAQEKYSITPDYKVISESGPDHNKIFTVGVYLADRQVAQGQGSSKQYAQIAAARSAINQMFSDLQNQIEKA